MLPSKGSGPGPQVEKCIKNQSPDGQRSIFHLHPRLQAFVGKAVILQGFLKKKKKEKVQAGNDKWEQVGMG